MDYQEKLQNQHKKRNNMVSLNFEINVGYNQVQRAITYTTNSIPIIQSINFRKARVQVSMKSFYPQAAFPNNNASEIATIQRNEQFFYSQQVPLKIFDQIVYVNEIVQKEMYFDNMKNQNINIQNVSQFVSQYMYIPLDAECKKFDAMVQESTIQISVNIDFFI